MYIIFHDMLSGGSNKLRHKGEWYSAAVFKVNTKSKTPVQDVVEVFEDTFNVEFDSVTCSCCGYDFSMVAVDELPDSIDDDDFFMDLTKEVE